MILLGLEIELHFPQAQSLKEKRARLRPVIDGLSNRFNVGVAEVEFQDLWQRATIGVALVGGEVTMVERAADEVERFVWSFPEHEVVAIERRWMEQD